MQEHNRACTQDDRWRYAPSWFANQQQIQRRRRRNLSWALWYCIRSFFSLSQHCLAVLLYWHTVQYSNTDSIYFRIFVHRIKLRVFALISLEFGKHERSSGCSVCFGLNVRVEYYDGYSSPLSRLATVASTPPADCAQGTYEPHQRPTFQVGLSTVWWNNCVLSHQINWTCGSSLHGSGPETVVWNSSWTAPVGPKLCKSQETGAILDWTLTWMQTETHIVQLQNNSPEGGFS